MQQVGAELVENVQTHGKSEGSRPLRRHSRRLAKIRLGYRLTYVSPQYFAGVSRFFPIFLQSR